MNREEDEVENVPGKDVVKGVVVMIGMLDVVAAAVVLLNILVAMVMRWCVCRVDGMVMDMIAVRWGWCWFWI